MARSQRGRRARRNRPTSVDEWPRRRSSPSADSAAAPRPVAPRTPLRANCPRRGASHSRKPWRAACTTPRHEVSMSLAALRYDEADDVIAGLRATRKHLPPRLLYTGAGAELRDRLCALDAYYPTRAELDLLDQFAQPIAQHIGPGVRVIEPGRPDAKRTRKLLHILD